MTDLRQRYVEELRRHGAPLAPELAAAFAAVPREVFVAEGFLRRDGSWARPGAAGFLADVYRDDVLVTKSNGRVAVSSSSQPSLMAIMLAALDVHPGDRVLEIGAGTGYNAALLAALARTSRAWTCRRTWRNGLGPRWPRPACRTSGWSPATATRACRGRASTGSS